METETSVAVPAVAAPFRPGVFATPSGAVCLWQARRGAAAFRPSLYLGRQGAVQSERLDGAGEVAFPIGFESAVPASIPGPV